MDGFMRQCSECNREFPDSIRFCPECGAKLVEQAQAAPIPARGVNVQDAVVVGGVHYSATDNRTIINQQDDTREVLTCSACGAHIRKASGFTCPQCGRFFCAQDYDKDNKTCRNCLETRAGEAVRRYGALLDEIMKDGRVDPAERAQLDQARAALGLSAETCARLEKERRAQGAAAGGSLGRRDTALLEEARRLQFGDLAFAEALRVAGPLWERHPGHAEIRRIYLLSLLEADPDRALDVMAGMRFDDLDKSLAAIEVLSRKGDFDRAYEVLEDARRAFGADHPDVSACETDLTLEEYRRTARRALLDVAVECGGRLQGAETDYSRFALAFLRHMNGDKRPLAELEQAGNYYAKRKKRLIQERSRPRPAEKPAPPPEPAPKTAPLPEKPEIKPAPPADPSPPLPVTPQPPPMIPQPPPPQAVVPGLWQLTVVSSWGQSFYGTCQVNVGGNSIMLVADFSGNALLWDGLMHFFQERSIFRGTVTGPNLIATCGELVRMVDGMVVPVAGLPMRLNAVLGDFGHSIGGTVVNMLGESARFFLKI